MPEQALIRNQGRRSCNHVCSTLLPSGNVPLRRSSSEPILRCKHESSPRNVPASKTHREKGANNLILATHEWSSERFSEAWRLFTCARGHASFPRCD